MINSVAEYFKEHPDSCVLFLFEDIDYYIETTKQVLLYKILDMLQYCAIKFAFVATSMKVDIADSFEKRVKSRFSHRQVLLYELQLEVFDKILKNQFKDRIDLIDADDESGKQLQDAYRDLHRLATCSGA
jgi:origin recognition complex subunit 4